MPYSPRKLAAALAAAALGYGPADVMLRVPVDNRLMATSEKVQIFAPYHVETVGLVRSAKSVPDFDGLDALAGKTIGVEKVSKR